MVTALDKADATLTLLSTIISGAIYHFVCTSARYIAFIVKIVSKDCPQSRCMPPSMTS